MVRIPFSTRAFVFGVWGHPEKKPDEHELLLRALDARALGVTARQIEKEYDSPWGG